jgi:hypothetical protein
MRATGLASPVDQNREDFTIYTLASGRWAASTSSAAESIASTCRTTLLARADVAIKALELSK